jgi:CDP-6-deoxy-D-xylo-4-hexulose-3-dehydrase
MIAHALGNPFDAEAISKIAKENDIWFIEDNCDALGSKINGKLTGTFGDIATVSFYPAHHITMGEGGCVLTNSPKLKKIIVYIIGIFSLKIIFDKNTFLKEIIYL